MKKMGYSDCIKPNIIIIMYLRKLSVIQKYPKNFKEIYLQTTLEETETIPKIYGSLSTK